MRCTVCNHPQCHDIDLALITRSHTLDVLKQQFGPSMSALHRHKKHLLKKLDRAEEKLANTVRLGYLFRLNTYLEEATATVKTAREEGNPRLSLQAVNSGTRIINFMNKLDVSLERDLVYRLMASPQWAEPDCLLPADPHILADSRTALARNLFSSCPEADPEELEDFDSRDLVHFEDEELEDSEDQDGSIAAAPETFESRQMEIENFLIQAATKMLSETPSHDRETQIENYPENKREIRAKLSPRTSPFTEKINENHRDRQSAKNLPKIRAVGRENAVHPAISESDPPSTDPCLSSNGKRKTASDLCPGLADPPRWTSSMCCDSDALYEEYLLETAALGISAVGRENAVHPAISESDNSPAPCSPFPETCLSDP